jgi:hypothetical protein
MDVGLAVGDHQYPLSCQLLVQQLAEGFGAPGDGGVVGEAALRIQGAEQDAQVPHQGLQFGAGGLLLGEGLQYPFPPEHGPHPLHPAAPAEMGHKDGDEGGDDAQHREEEDDVLAGVGTAALHEAHVVHQDEGPFHPSLSTHGVGGDVHGALGELLDQAALPVGGAGGGAAEGIGERGGAVAEHPLLIAVAQGQQPLVLDGAEEEGIDPCPLPLCQELGQGVMQGVGDETGADIHVPDEPAQRQAVHQWDHAVGQQGQGDDQGDDEAQRQAQGTEGNHGNS